MIGIVCLIAGLGGSAVTGLAGLSAAVVIKSLLICICICGRAGCNAVIAALAADVPANLLTAMAYRKNGSTPEIIPLVKKLLYRL